MSTNEATLILHASKISCTTRAIRNRLGAGFVVQCLFRAPNDWRAVQAVKSEGGVVWVKERAGLQGWFSTSEARCVIYA